MRFHSLSHSVVAVAIAAAAWTAAAQDAGDASKTIVIKADRIHTISGDPIEDGVIVVRGGKIVSVGRQSVDQTRVAQPPPADTVIIELPDSVVTPGLIDAHAAVSSEIPQTHRDPRRRVSIWNELAAAAVASGPGNERPVPFPGPQDHPADDSLCPICAADPARAALVCPQRAQHKWTMATGCPICGYPNHLAAAVGVTANQTWSENSSEVTPHLNVIDSLNLSSNDFNRLLRGGVTTVWVSPDSGNVIGMRGAIVKTAGPRGDRILREAGAVKAVMGRDPVTRGGFNRTPRPERFGGVTFSTRRPTTRMGVHWVFRKAFYDAMRYAQGLPIHGADMPPIEAIPVLMKVLGGEIPLRIQARTQHDILLAIALSEEFDLGTSGRVPFVLEEATESYQCLAQLKAANIPVVFGPIFSQPSGFRARASGEANDPRLNTAKRLIDAGITTAITAHEMRDEEGLVRQAMVAVRYGLSPDAALRAITRTPAEIMNVRDRVGTLSPGADADLVIWSREPLHASSRVLLVMIDGQVVYRAGN